MNFGDILRELLDERAISQKKLAEDLNMAPSTLGNYIRNLREPDFDTLKKISQYFSISIDYLLGNSISSNYTHSEDQLLRIYKMLPKDLQTIYLSQGKAMLKHCKHMSNDKF